MHWSLPDAGLVTLRDEHGGVKFKEVPWFNGSKPGFYFGSWDHDGKSLVGYIADRATLPCDEFHGAKKNRVFTTRDGILGYHHDKGPNHIVLDQANSSAANTDMQDALRAMGWLNTTVDPSSTGPQPSPAPKAGFIYSKP